MDKTPRQIATETAEAIRDGVFRLLPIDELRALATEYLRLSTQSSRGGKAGTQAQHAARKANSKKGGWPKGKKRGPRNKPGKVVDNT